MTWLGKILTFVVMIAAVAWMYFTVQAYVTRTVWKTAVDKHFAAATASEAARKSEAARNQANEDAWKRLWAVEQVRADKLQKEVNDLKDSSKKVKEAYDEQQQTILAGDVTAKISQANTESTLKELDSVRLRNNTLEDKTNQLVIDAEKARLEMVRAQNSAKLAQAISEDYAKKVEELALKVNELRATGGSLRAQLEKPPPPLLSNLRGEVSQVRGELVILTIGVDAGLSRGNELELSRLAGGGRYLGKVKIVDVKEKEATGVFMPARSNVRFEQLRPEELPRKGDEVKPSESAISGIINPR